MAGVFFPEDEIAVLRNQVREIGNPLHLDQGKVVPINPVQVSSMVSQSGMSFPQINAQTHLSWLYIHLKMAKELGVRYLLNTGEGGAALHLALLSGDRDAITNEVVQWNLEHNRKNFKLGGMRHAKVVHFLHELMNSRDELFKEFSAQDLAKAQIVVQVGSALNGVRTEDNHVDYAKIAKIGATPGVAMFQFKLGQAAKRGAKLDASKVNDVVAAFRNHVKESEAPQNIKSPETHPEMDSYEDIAKLIVTTKYLTYKPVSIKLPVGNVKDVYEFFKYLRDAGALPDHVQLDGNGEDFSAGSGNAPPGASASLFAAEAVIAVDAVLKKLGVRDQIYLESSGDIQLPADAVERLALGADGVSAARLWMRMGVGCAEMRRCSTAKGCLYGISSGSETTVGLGLEPLKIAPKGYLAVSNWWKAYTQTLAETGVTDWRKMRVEAGLASGQEVKIRKKKGYRMLPLDRYYGEEEVADLLRGVIDDREELRRIVYKR
jgi:glutamate synthase domain-containing protein 2